MKKIIALAVASAFIAPAFAADVTISGDVEYKFTKLKNEGVAAAVGDNDFKISATEEVDGMTVGAYLMKEDRDGSTATKGAVTVSGAFGSIAVGDDVDHAINQIDEIADVAESGLGDSNPGLPTGAADKVKLAYTLPTIVDGLTVIASYGAEAGDMTDDNTSTEQQHTSLGAKYSVNGLGLHFGRASGDAVPTTITYAGVSYATGPFYVAYQSASDNQGVDGTNDSGFGITYNYGPGKIYFEDQKEDTSTTSVSNSAYGISYKIGGMNTYVEMQSGDTDAEDGMTVGVEYAF